MLMRDSKVPDAWIREQMIKNPPSLRPNGSIFSGPVRLCFPNLFKAQTAKNSDGEPKFGADLLFPPGTDMSLFAKIWTEQARIAFPDRWTPDGKPIGLHSPFHDQVEKTIGKGYAGYTPGAIHFTTSSKYKPVVVDPGMNPVTDEARVYPGVWAFVALNHYKYSNKKTGIGFGLQTVMLIMDDQKLGGGGSDPTKDFAHVQISASSNIAAQFDAAGIMPQGGHVGQPGTMTTQALPEVSLADLG